MTDRQIVTAINDTIGELSEEQVEDILWYLDFHACEPMAAAERISSYLGCDYRTIFNLL